MSSYDTREFSVRRLYTELRRAYRAARQDPFAKNAAITQTAILSALRTLTGKWDPGVFPSIYPRWNTHATCDRIILRKSCYYRPRVANTTIRFFRKMEAAA